MKKLLALSLILLMLAAAVPASVVMATAVEELQIIGAQIKEYKKLETYKTETGSGWQTDYVDMTDYIDRYLNGVRKGLSSTILQSSSYTYFTPQLIFNRDVVYDDLLDYWFDDNGENYCIAWYNGQQMEPTNRIPFDLQVVLCSDFDDSSVWKIEYQIYKNDDVVFTYTVVYVYQPVEELQIIGANALGASSIRTESGPGWQTDYRDVTDRANRLWSTWRQEKWTMLGIYETYTFPNPIYSFNRDVTNEELDGLEIVYTIHDAGYGSYEGQEIKFAANEAAQDSASLNLDGFFRTVYLYSFFKGTEVGIIASAKIEIFQDGQLIFTHTINMTYDPTKPDPYAGPQRRGSFTFASIGEGISFYYWNRDGEFVKIEENTGNVASADWDYLDKAYSSNVFIKLEPGYELDTITGFWEITHYPSYRSSLKELPDTSFTEFLPISQARDRNEGELAAALQAGCQLFTNFQTYEEFGYLKSNRIVDLVATTTYVGLRGDANSDGVINYQDVIVIAKDVSGWERPDNFCEFGADANGDGAIDYQDIILVAKHVVGWDIVLGMPGE